MASIVFVIDPQSVNSLAAYDRCMLEGIHNIKIHFFGNVNYNDEPLKSNVRFTPVFNYGNCHNSFLKGISYLGSLIMLVCYAIRERPRVAHFQWIRQWNLDWTIISFMKRILGIKIVFTVHNILPRERKKSTYHRFKKLYNLSDILIAHTETTKVDLEKMFGIKPSKIVVMPHGVIEMKVSEKDYLESAKKLESKYHFCNKTVFGALGVQSHYKGTDLLIKAWQSVPNLTERDDILLLIAGKPSGIQIPLSLPENIVVIPQLLSNPDFKYLLKRTDVMMLPYRAIEQSGVLLSLIQEHKPYCCTNVGELNKPFEIADIGWQINDTSSESIADIIKEIVADLSKIKKKQSDEKGWERLMEVYSWKRSNTILQGVYNKLLNS